MYVCVRLLKGYAKPLWYKACENHVAKIKKGSIVQVPLRTQVLPAVVLYAFKNPPPHASFNFRETLELELFPQDPKYHTFVEKIATFYRISPLTFYKRIRTFLKKTKRVESEAVREKESSRSTSVTLTNDQQAIVTALEPMVSQPTFTPALIHGVTGAGKTEVYKKLIEAAIKAGRSVILMLPEVTLALQFERLLKRTLPSSIHFCSFHSGTREPDKRTLWKNLLDQKPMVILGVHMPILLPIANLGLIIVDEEHEGGFVEKKHPKINSKELALWRAKHYEIPVILGSATPSLTSLASVKHRGWKFFSLTKRFRGAFPQIKHVYLKGGDGRRTFWVSSELRAAIAKRLECGEQTLIFINRRGHSFFVQCKSCGYIPECSDCSVSLTYHETSPEFPREKAMRCHYCNFQCDIAKSCPDCKNPNDDLLKKGIGTQQASALLKELFPSARIGRADMDMTKKKEAWKNTLDAFEAGELDILVGTQTITKGYHFPGVTLVGILWADLNLHIPYYNASERTLQQLIQVAGRAGREKSESLVIIQSIKSHQVFKYLHEIDYLKFYSHEMAFRREANYPPYCKFIQVELKHTNATIIEKEAVELAEKLCQIADEKNLPLIVLGPVKPPVYKIARSLLRHVFIKSPSFALVHELLNNAPLDTFKSKIYLVPTA